MILLLALSIWIQTSSVPISYQRVIEPVAPIDRADWGICDLEVVDCTEKIKRLIIDLAKEYGVDENEALRVAYCESRSDPFAKSKISSASGVYQIISKTFSVYGEGDVFDPEDNTRTFMRLWPKHSNWWEC